MGLRLLLRPEENGGAGGEAVHSAHVSPTGLSAQAGADGDADRKRPPNQRWAAGRVPWNWQPLDFSLV